MAYTGFIVCTVLEEVYADTNLPTGLEKPNLPNDADYIPPQYRPDICFTNTPPPTPTPTPTQPPTYELSVIVDGTSFINKPNVNYSVSFEGEMVGQTMLENSYQEYSVSCQSGLRTLQFSIDASSGGFTGFYRVFRNGVDITNLVQISNGGYYDIDSNYLVNNNNANIVFYLQTEDLCQSQITVTAMSESNVFYFRNNTKKDFGKVDLFFEGSLVNSVLTISANSIYNLLPSSIIRNTAVSLNLTLTSTTADLGYLPKFRLLKKSWVDGTETPIGEYAFGYSSDGSSVFTGGEYITLGTHNPVGKAAGFNITINFNTLLVGESYILEALPMDFQVQLFSSISDIEVSVTNGGDIVYGNTLPAGSPIVLSLEDTATSMMSFSIANNSIQDAKFLFSRGMSGLPTSEEGITGWTDLLVSSNIYLNFKMPYDVQAGETLYLTIDPL